ncbi:uncharacterized protein EV420DRAFT_761296 [Desarmillaria tabescens]|uniref:REJ domain-containing protein n=1 Tax=Armillaria tabescens TaxID=1929756 RepID=A0AA39MXI2_ARMTA|nr:uncharacterized protein EV420DRAFT_761296 [Desarmillaria tabescens]KAK0449719.1 hypothetical protein EV420DRAFT_761296 [Desarmillaria tabescens]
MSSSAGSSSVEASTTVADTTTTTTPAPSTSSSVQTTQQSTSSTETTISTTSTTSSSFTPPPTDSSSSSSGTAASTTSIPPDTTTSATSAPPTDTTSSSTDTGSGGGPGQGQSQSQSQSSNGNTQQHTSYIATTLVITQSNGQQVTATTSIVAPSSSSSSASSSSSSSHTGAIVGGTIGGIAGLAVVLALLLFLYKRRQNDLFTEKFDGNFDPDRIVARTPDMGLNLDDEHDQDDGMGGRLGGAEIGAGVVSPFPISTSTNSQGSNYANYYNGSPASPPPMSQYSGDSYPPSAYNPYAMVPSSPPGSPVSHTPPPSSSGVGGGMSAKEREARQHQLGIVNPDDRSAYLVNGPGPSGVIQHQDAGPSEIPPSYDSLLPGPSRTGTPQGGNSS